MKTKAIILTAIAVAVSVSLPGQTKQSYYGYNTTPKGDFHALFIIVSQQCPYDSAELAKWPLDSMPSWSKGGYNDIIDIDTSQIGTIKNLTDYYNIMSIGKFKLTGEFFPSAIQVPCDTISGDDGPVPIYASSWQKAIDSINAKSPNYNWAKFDNRRNLPIYDFDNSLYSDNTGTVAGPDGKVDFITLMFRWGNSGGRDGLPSDGGRMFYTTHGGSADTFDIAHGIQSQRNAHGDSTGFKRHLFHHEFAHWLYRAPHVFAANGTFGKRFYSNSGWGMITDGFSDIFQCPNSWQRWWLDWSMPTTVTSSGNYTIGDYIPTGEALRIEIPETENEYLWIENHQLDSYYDGKSYADKSQTLPGIYMYVSAGGNDRTTPSEIDIDIPSTNRYKVLNADGNYDFSWMFGDSVEVPSVGDESKNEHQFFLRRGEANPISGQSDFEWIRYDYNQNDTIEIAIGANKPNSPSSSACPLPSTLKCFNEVQGFWAELIDDSIHYTYSLTGDTGLAFQVGDEVGLSGIVPALNYPIYEHSVSKLDPYILNGISVKISSYNSTTKEYTLDIDLNDWTLRSDKRWSGDILLSEYDSLVIDTGVVLLLNRTGTVNRHDRHSLHEFYNPTAFTQEDHSQIELLKSACVIVSEGATFDLASQAHLILRDNALIRVENGGRIVIADSTRIELYDSSFIQIDSGGIVELYGNDITLHDTDGHLRLNPYGTIKTTIGVDFSFSGLGYLDYYKDGILDLHSTSHFKLLGSAPYDRKIVIRDGAELHLEGIAGVDVENGNIQYEDFSKLRLVGVDAEFDKILFSGYGYSNQYGVYAERNSELFIYRSEFDNIDNPVYLYDLDTCPKIYPARIIRTDFEQYEVGVYAEKVKRLFVVSSNFYGANAYWGMELEECSEVVVDRTLIEDHDGSGLAAIKADTVQSIIALNATIRDNHYGIDARKTNIFVRNGTTIDSNAVGISLQKDVTDPSQMYLVVIGDMGCGWIIDNTVGVEGTDILLAIDAELHAVDSVPGDPYLVEHNRFDGNSTVFDINYDEFKGDIDTISAKGNFWTTVGGIDSVNYTICKEGTGPCFHNPIPVRDDSYVTTQPANCSTIGYPVPPPSSQQMQARFAQVSCNVNIPVNGTNKPLGLQYAKAYKDFQDGSVNTAYVKFDNLLIGVDSVSPNLLTSARCKYQIRSSEVSQTLMNGLALAYCVPPYATERFGILIEEDEDPLFKLYPNPAFDFVFIELLGKGEHEVRIYDIYGKLHYARHIAGNQLVSLQDYPSGVYLFTCSDHDESQSIRLVVNR